MIASTVSGHLYRLVADGAARFGAALRTLPLAGELTVRIPTVELWTLWTEIVTALQGPELGVRMAERATFGRLGLWDHLYLSSPTLREAMEQGIAHMPTVTDPAASYLIIEHEHGVEYAFRPAPSPHPEITMVTEEFGLAMLYRRVLEATSTVPVPLHVGFRRRAPAPHTYANETFSTSKVEFGQPYTSMTLRYSDLAQPLVTADPAMAEYARNRLRTKVPHTLPTWDELFARALDGALDDGDPSLSTVASRLAMSPRTLQRRLHEQGRSWRDELAQARHERSTALLRGTDLTVESIAHRVGYTDVRALRRAYQRWSGHTPGAVRSP